ncbi:hypothetical protein EDB80DRAFT_815732 [Ilyonectria destructans]|nr:hypothetical protein EDB80DRAFT_815732 [Ilyonectria destructans]
MAGSANTIEGNETPSHRLASWACALTFADVPSDVVDRVKSLYLDWLGSALAGRNYISVISMLKLTRTQGPSNGKCGIVGYPGVHTSPVFAALVNGASSHVVEQDDLHNSSMMHPATVVFPAALAVAQETGASGENFIVACVVGYEYACRHGQRLGKSHYKKFHTTATAGIIGAAAAASYLLRHDVPTMLSAVGTAGTQASGLWQFLLDATHSKQVHTAKAASDGVLSSYLADSGLLGPVDILEGERGMVATLSSGQDSKPSVIDAELGSTWSVLSSSFKWHASCRHTHPSVDALLALMKSEHMEAEDIEYIEAHTYKAAIDILTLSEAAESVHQSKFSMGFVLAIAAHQRRASILDFTEEALLNPELRQFQKRVKIVLDKSIDHKFPKEWLGKVVVITKDGNWFEKEVNVVKGDPGWTLTRDEIESKFLVLANYGNVKELQKLRGVMARVWSLEDQENMLDY